MEDNTNEQIVSNEGQILQQNAIFQQRQDQHNQYMFQQPQTHDNQQYSFQPHQIPQDQQQYEFQNQQQQQQQQQQYAFQQQSQLTQQQIQMQYQPQYNEQQQMYYQNYGDGNYFSDDDEYYNVNVIDSSYEIGDNDFEYNDFQQQQQQPQQQFQGNYGYNNNQLQISNYDTAQYIQTHSNNVQNTQHNISEVYIAFVIGENVTSSKSWKIWMNYIISISGTYTHCEFIFKMKDNTYMACSIHYDGKVEFETKKYLEKTWELFRIVATPDEALQMYKYCNSITGKPFNTKALYFNFIPFLKYFSQDTDDESFICSQLCLRILQQTKQEYRQYEAHKVTPYDLYKIIQSHSDYVMDNFYGIDNATNNEITFVSDQNV